MRGLIDFFKQLSSPVNIFLMPGFIQNIFGQYPSIKCVLVGSVKIKNLPA
jgi:hypothetical protein